MEWVLHVDLDQFIADAWDDVRAEVVALARTVAGELGGRPARRVGVTVRRVPFTTRTRSATLPAPTTFAAAACEVLDRFPTRRAVRAGRGAGEL